ncbi:MAG: hypothetical protein M1275_01620 [Patescibacteria group bacterium]|nr:hypothetical protein [Patescibacteria group bacterium]
MVKIGIITLLFFGEALAIFVEIGAAKKYYGGTAIFPHLFLQMFALITLADGFLIAGYMLGIRAFQNIWIVSVISLTSILIIEPTLDYLIFAQVPTRGALVGLVLGVLGFISAVIL